MTIQPISTAPKDGRVILVSHPDVGVFAMFWNPSATNHLFAPGQSGMWETLDGQMTWSDVDGCGPSQWSEIEPEEAA